MQYKTIILELILQNQPLHDQLRSQRKLLVTVDRLAAELKADHETYLSQMTQPETTESQTALAQRAFEMAIKEAEERLQSMTPAEATVPGVDTTTVASGSKTSPGE